MTTGAEQIGRALHAAGCRRAFGIPGGEVLALLDGLDRAGIAFHLAKHENAAGFMAEGVWQATGAPALLVATIGPGFANCVNVVANALQDRVPLILLTGRVDPVEAETYTHQVMDHQAVIRPVVKASFSAAAGSVAVVIAKALALACSGQPGPVHIDVPIAIAEGQEPDTSVTVPVLPRMRPADGPALERARAALKSAERPLVIAGVDAVNHEASIPLLALCEALGAPLITTYKGKGLLPEDHSLALGGAGLSPRADKVLMPLLAAADVIVLAGYDPIEMRIGWRDPWPEATPVVALSAVAPSHFMHRETMSFVGDVGEGLDALRSDLAPRATWPAGEPAQARAALRSLFAPEPDWGPGVVFDTLRRLAPDETVITIDSGAHRILLSQIWTTFTPRTVLQSTGFCTMGCALPLAIGHALAEPETPVIAFMGDAGLEMVAGELATLRDLALPVTVVVLVDEALALIELKQRAMNKPSMGVTFGGTDFARVAEAFGGQGFDVSDRQGLEDAWRAARAETGRFTLIAARIAPHAYEGRF